MDTDRKILKELENISYLLDNIQTLLMDAQEKDDIHHKEVEGFLSLIATKD